MSIQKNIKNNQNPSIVTTPEKNESKISSRVNINHLIARVKEREKKENKKTLIYISFFLLTICSLGIIVTL